MAEDKPILRVTRTKEEAQRSYDRLSRWYDLFSGKGELKLGVETLDMMRIPVSSTFLEVGFGTGRILLDLIRRVGENGRIYGIDLSQCMCRLTRLRLEKAGVFGQVLLTCGDGYRLPLAPGSVDGIFMGFTLELFDTPELLPVIQECLRILKPDGQVGIVTMSIPNRYGFIERLYRMAHERWPRLVDCRPIDPVSLLFEAGITCQTLKFTKLWGLSVAQWVLVKNG